MAVKNASVKRNKATCLNNISSEHLLYMLVHVLMFTCPYCLTLWCITAFYQVSFVWASYIHCLKINMVTQHILICIVVLRSRQWSLRCLSQCCYTYMTIFLTSDTLQYGFKKHSGCTHALSIYCWWNCEIFHKKRIESHRHLIKSCTIVNCIFKKLLDKGIPVSFNQRLRHWYDLKFGV